MEIDYTSNNNLILAIFIITYIIISIIYVTSIFKAGSLLNSFNKNDDYEKTIKSAGKWLKIAAFFWSIYILFMMYALSCNFF
jgi:Na+-driven multidrug efflux pump